MAGWAIEMGRKARTSEGANWQSALWPRASLLAQLWPSHFNFCCQSNTIIKMIELCRNCLCFCMRAHFESLKSTVMWICHQLNLNYTETALSTLEAVECLPLVGSRYGYNYTLLSRLFLMLYLLEPRKNGAQYMCKNILFLSFNTPWIMDHNVWDPLTLKTQLLVTEWVPCIDLFKFKL